MTDVDQLRQFYLDTSDEGENLFAVWERGDARGDSVTPSTYSPEYRDWMAALLRGHLDAAGGGLISLGCGNAVIEAQLARAGYTVLAVDMFPQAVELARRKGVEAVCADITHWHPPHERPWSVLYADGLMGHLYQDPQEGLLSPLCDMHDWLSPEQGVLVISNDRPKEVSEVEPAAGVPGFYWLSEEFLRKQTAMAGFHELSCTTFLYERPLSGIRARTVLTVRA